MSSVPEFYGVAAQVLPVMLLTLAFQMRGGIVPSPGEQQYEQLERLRPKLMEIAREAGKLWLPDVDESQLTPEQRLARAAEAEEWALRRTGEDLERASQLADRSRVISSAASIVVIAVLFVGEALALRVLLRGETTTGAQIIVESSLFLGAAMIAWPLIDSYVERIASVHVRLLPYRYFSSMGLVAALLAATYVVWA
jgi:hypothetical protein